MSGFAFSHQFSQRWLATPPPVKQTIIQELDDIVNLLQPETDLDSYRFSVPNLHDKVEQLMAIEAIRQEKIQAEERKREREEQERLERERLEQQRLENERLEQERLEQERIEKERLEKEQAEQQRLEQEKREQEKLEKERLEQEQLEKQRLEQQQLDQQRLEQDQAEILALENERAIAKKANLAKTTQADDTPSITIERHSSEMVYAISGNETAISDSISEVTDNPQTTTEIEAKPNSKNKIKAKTKTNDAVDTVHPQDASTVQDIAAIKQQITEQLQAHIDTYLQESIAIMKEDLQKWLSEEVDKQLEQHLSHSNRQPNQ